MHLKQRDKTKLKIENISPEILTAIFSAGRIGKIYTIMKFENIYRFQKGWQIHKFIEHFGGERINLFLIPLLIKES